MHILVGPADVLFILDLLALHGGVHYLVYLFLGLEAEGIESKIVQLVVLVYDEHYLVIVVRP